MSKEAIDLDGAMKLLFNIQESKLMIPVLNFLFDTKLSTEIDAEIDFLDTSLIIRPSEPKLYADKYIHVCQADLDYYFHVEFQLADDTAMATRMFEYGYYFARKLIESYHTVYFLFPHQAVIYFENEPSVTDAHFFSYPSMDSKYHNYSYKIKRLWEWDKEQLFKEKLFMRYPLIVFSYRKKIDEERGKNGDSEMLDKYLNEISTDISHIYDELKFNSEDGLINPSSLEIIDKVMEYFVSYMFRRYEFYEKLLEEYKMKREKLNVKAFSDNYTYKTALKEALINIYRIKGLLNQDVKYLIETERDVGKLDKWNKLALKENLTDEDVEIFARNLNVV